jgi:hypothetical protein
MDRRDGFAPHDIWQIFLRAIEVSIGGMIRAEARPRTGLNRIYGMGNEELQ